MKAAVRMDEGPKIELQKNDRKTKGRKKGPDKNQLLPDPWGYGDTYMLDPVCAGTGRGKDTPQRDLGFSPF